MTTIDIQKAMFTMLTDRSFIERMDSYSLISKKSQGVTDAVRVCNDLMNRNAEAEGSKQVAESI